MSDQTYNVLFLSKDCTARTVMAEVILNRLGGERFKAFSAGYDDVGDIHPYTRDLMKTLNYNLDTCAAKKVQDIEEEMDFIFCVSEEPAISKCPPFKGEPMSANWGVPDPTKVEGKEAEIRLAFSETYRMLYNRIDIFVNLPLNEDRFKLQDQLNIIGH